MRLAGVAVTLLRLRWAVPLLRRAVALLLRLTVSLLLLRLAVALLLLRWLAISLLLLLRLAISLLLLLLSRWLAVALLLRACRRKLGLDFSREAGRPVHHLRAGERFGAPLRLLLLLLSLLRRVALLRIGGGSRLAVIRGAGRVAAAGGLIHRVLLRREVNWSEAPALHSLPEASVISS